MEKIKKRKGNLAVWLGIIAGIFLIGGKLVLGILGRSQALIADAIHSVTDFITDIFAFLGLHFAFKKEDSNHPFGHGKIDSMMSILIGVSMLLAGIWLGYDAVMKLIKGEMMVPNQLALFGAIGSIVIKETLFRYTLKVGKEIKNQSLVANAWHHRSDVYSSVAVVVGIVPALISPELAFCDSLAAVVVSIMIVKAGYDVVRPAFLSTIDTGPNQEIVKQIQDISMEVEGVIDAHDVRGRYYSDQLYLELHIVVDPQITVAEGHLIAVKVVDTIKEKMDNILDVIIHVDPDDSEWNQPRFN